ncbi:MAG: helix-hairpin-helix domain-containing protein [Promethearchaeota archaeon]
MSLKLEDVKGLGKKIEDLKGAGIDTIDKLANATVDELLGIKGIGQASAQKYIDNAKELLEKQSEKQVAEGGESVKEDNEEAKKIQEELKKLEEKKKQLEGKKVEDGDFILVKITARTQNGKVFQVSSVEDAKTAGIYDEKKEQQGFYTPEFVIVAKPGFLNEGLTETIKEMNYFQKKSVRIPPTKAFGKRDPQKIERIGIAKFRKLNNGKNPELGQEYVKQTQQGQAQRGTVIRITQGKVVVDYNHPLAGQSIDYNLEIIDKIEDFEEKIEYFMTSKGIPKQNIADFKINYNKADNSIEFHIPKMFMFQNLTYLKFGLAIDLQTHMDIGDVKFIEVFEKMPIPTDTSESVMKKVEELNKGTEEENSKEEEKEKPKEK